MEIITKSQMDKRYGPGWSRILGGYVKPLPRKGREWRKYEILKPLPDQKGAEYLDARRAAYTTTVGSLVDDAMSEIEELAAEMREACDNTPESLQGTDVYERRGEAADALEGLERPDLPDEANELSVFYLPQEGVSSRRERASEAADMLRTAAGELRDLAAEDLEEADDIEGVDGDADASERQAEWEEYANTLDELADEIEGVEFPGMYG